MRGGQRLRRTSGAPRPLNYGWKNKCGRTGCGCPGEYGTGWVQEVGEEKF